MDNSGEQVGGAGPTDRPDAADGRRRWPTRRDWLRRGGLTGFGVALGVVGLGQLADVRDRKLPLLPGAQSATTSDRSGDGGRGQLRITWNGQSAQKLIALTFDDGPRPQWTELVLDILDEHQVPATFFMVGSRVRKYGSVVHGRLDRHEVGNHSWNHVDLARRTQSEAYEDLYTAHQAIVEVIGRVPKVCRPPYGHFGGSAMLVADRLDYEIILWSLQMQEQSFPGDPLGHARHIVSQVVPNTILLGHDIDAQGRNRRISIDGLPLMFDELRGQGYEFVTVSDMLARGRPASLV